VAEPRPGTVTVSSGDLEDPYLHLEDDTPEVLAWQRDESAAAEAWLDEWPGFEQLLGDVAAETVAVAPWAPVRAGEYVFAVQGGKLLVTEDGATRSLLAPTQVDATTIDWWYPSPGGRHVAVGVSRGGDEQSVLRVVETATGRVLDDAIPHCSHSGVGWLPDETTFYVNAGHAPDAIDATKLLYCYALGDGKLGDPEALPGPLGVVANPRTSADGRFVVLMSYPAVLTWRATYVLDRASDVGWRLFSTQGAEQLSGEFVGTDYVAVTRDGAPRGRLVSIPVGTSADPTTWVDVVPEGERVLLESVVSGDLVALHELDHAASCLRVVTSEGVAVWEVPLPRAGTLSRLRRDGDRRLAFDWQGFTSSVSSWTFDLVTGETARTQAPARELDGVEVLEISARSADGTVVPAHLVRRAGSPDGPVPVVLHAYGGFNARFTPEYLGAFAPLVAAGGVYVRVYARGGGEFGSDWWHGGRMATKQHTFDDVHAVAEHLIATGVTTAGQLGVTGASNGGLMAAVVAVQRPDLYRASVPVVPVLDLARAAKDPFMAAGMRLEYGEPDDPEQMRWMLGYSPYNNIRSGTDYPAVMVAGGANDFRCPAWHGRKFVARLRHASTSGRPVLLRLWDDVGHGTGTTPENAARVAGEPVAFLMKELGF